MAEPTLLSVTDTCGIELIHPRREGRSAQQIRPKGKSNGRWIVGAKLFLCKGRLASQPLALVSVQRYYDRNRFLLVHWQGLVPDAFGAVAPRE